MFVAGQIEEGMDTHLWLLVFPEYYVHKIEGFGNENKGNGREVFIFSAEGFVRGNNIKETEKTKYDRDHFHCMRIIPLTLILDWESYFSITESRKEYWPNHPKRGI